MNVHDQTRSYREPIAPSCRDKGRGRVDAGALCLSSWEYDHHASRNPNETSCHEDKHKAPTPLHVHPLSLQDGGGRFS